MENQESQSPQKGSIITKVEIVPGGSLVPYWRRPMQKIFIGDSGKFYLDRVPQDENNAIDWSTKIGQDLANLRYRLVSSEGYIWLKNI